MVKLPKIKWGRGKWTFCAAVRLVTFFGGVAVSSAVSYHWAEKKFRTEYEQQLGEVKRFYKNRAKEDDLKDDLLKKEYVQTNRVPMEEKFKPVEENYSELPEDKQALLEEYASKQVTVTTGPGLRVPPKGKIHLISQGEYFDSSEAENQEKVNWLYYEEDEVMVDPLEDVVEDYKRLVGDEFSYNFANYGHGGRVYVRNTVIDVDYEIELVQGAYHRDVLGYEADMRVSPRSAARDE